jgi:hypothetical protein
LDEVGVASASRNVATRASKSNIYTLAVGQSDVPGQGLNSHVPGEVQPCGLSLLDVYEAWIKVVLFLHRSGVSIGALEISFRSQNDLESPFQHTEGGL